VRDGVLRFNTETGVFAAKIPFLTVTDRRAVAASLKFVFATDANQAVRLDPASDVPGGTVGTLAQGLEIVDAATRASSVDAYFLATDAAGAWFVSDRRQELPLPEQFTPTGISAGADVVWIEGSRAGVPTLLVIDPNGSKLEVARTVRLANTSDLAVTFTSKRTVFVASAGSIYRVQLPE
jgi:hypothetical protein